MKPKPLPRYRGSLFDSSRWAGVTLRPGDIVLSTPPKSGTTWTLAMIYMLLHGPKAEFDNLSRVAPWIDYHGENPGAPLPALAAGRRLFKTHTPLDGIGSVKGVKFITVYRDPGSSFLSMRRHLANMRSPPTQHPNQGRLDAAFKTFLTRSLDMQRFDGVTISGILHHLKCSGDAAALKLHYADIFSDPERALLRMAGHIDVATNATTVRAILQATQKSNMRQAARRFTPEASTGLFRSDARFFSDTDATLEHLSDQQRAQITRRISDATPSERSRWLCRPA